MSRDTFTPAQLERFWKNVDAQEDPDACWLWKAGKMGEGDCHGELRLNGVRGAHAVAYVIGRGVWPLPEGYEVRHLCHVKLCCNPRHVDAAPRYVNAMDVRIFNFAHPCLKCGTMNRRDSDNRCRTCQANRMAEYKERQRAA